MFSEKIREGSKSVTPFLLCHVGRKWARPKRTTKRPQHYSDDIITAKQESSEDPFRLVPLEQYSAEFPAPFSVDISSQALVILLQLEREK